MDTCATCQTPFGKRNRCYRCTPGRQRSGETRNCLECNSEFYIQRHQVADVERKTGSYCSVKCKVTAQGKRLNPRARPHEKLTHSAGYVLVWAPEHPRATRNRVFEHILVMEKKLGRELRSDEFVHHKDENKQNNHPDNLEIKSNPEHGRWHARRKRETRPPKRVPVQCEHCGQTFEVKPYQANLDKPKYLVRYCSKKCRYQANGPKISGARKQSK